jgi:hypothetical protein
MIHGGISEYKLSCLFLLRDLGVSRIDSEFSPHAPLAFESVEKARTFLGKWGFELARHWRQI